MTFPKKMANLCDMLRTREVKPVSHLPIYVCVECVPLVQLSPGVLQGLHGIAHTVQCSTIFCLFSGFQLPLRAC